MGPLTLGQWLSALRRRGVQCRLHGDRLRVTGLRKLTPAEHVALFASAEQVKELLQARAERRRKEQHEKAAIPQQCERRVIGQHVSPGRPLRLLFDDEVKAIPTQRARVLGTVPYGWRK